MRFLSVCSGMEAASVAWEPLGWKAVGFSEIEPFPCAILAHRFPNTPNYGSLTEHHTWPIEPGTVDLLVGGTPCQSYSVAGKRGGLNDPRGQLMLSFLDLAQRLKARWVVWENVPGVLSSGQPRGSDFATFLQGLVERGYGWAFRVLDAQHFGVPQRRRRVFVVACLGAGGWESAAKVLFEPESLCGDTAKGRKKGQGVASDAQGGAGSGSGCWWDGGQVSQTLDAVLQKGQTMPEKNRFPAVLQPIVIDRAAFNQGENAKVIDEITAAHLNHQDTVGTLCARDFKGVGNQYVQEGKCIPCNAIPIQDGREVEKHQNGLGVGKEGDPAYTIDTMGAQAAGVPFRKSKRASSATDSESWVEAEALAITFQPGNLRREAGAEPSTTTTTTTLKASAGDQMPHVVHPVVPLDGMNLLSRLGKCGEEHSMQNFDPNDPQFTLRKGGCQHGVLTPMAVRRLTPTECERLQGFPDGWSCIPWKGKPADQCPDGPRYKACGNSMAVPVMRWIGTRIALVEQLSNHQA